MGIGAPGEHGASVKITVKRQELGHVITLRPLMGERHALAQGRRLQGALPTQKKKQEQQLMGIGAPGEHGASVKRQEVGPVITLRPPTGERHALVQERKFWGAPQT